MLIKQTIRNTNWPIAILFSGFLSAFNIVNNSQQRIDNTVGQNVLTWAVTFLYLLIIWYVNAFLTEFFENSKKHDAINKNWIVRVISNALLLALFILISVNVLNEFTIVSVHGKYAYLLITLKGFVSISIVNIIQNALNSNAKVQKARLQNQMLQTENIRSQFEILRQQVNPHFLFNSLSTLRSMVRSNNPNSERFVMKLSEMYRKLLLKRNQDVVDLSEELEFVEDYSFMLLSRFENMLRITTDIPAPLLSHKLPTFSLQLLIENCIKHNALSSDEPLEIKIFSSASGTLTVENKIHPKITQPEGSGYGLQNLIQRYNLLEVRNGVAVFSDAVFFRVTLKLLNP